MPKLCSWIKDTWLDSAVPTTLEDMTTFRKTIALVQAFANNVRSLKWAGAQELDEWVANAPKIWLSKRRETALDWTRNQLSLGKIFLLYWIIDPSTGADIVPLKINYIKQGCLRNFALANFLRAGIGKPQKVDRVEIQQISSIQEELQNKPIEALRDNVKGEVAANGAQDDDVADAWGWGDDDVIEEAHTLEDKQSINEENPALKDVTSLTETYTISSMPGPVLKTVKEILEDGASLTQDPYVWFSAIFSTANNPRQQRRKPRSFSGSWPFLSSKSCSSNVSGCVTLLLFD